MRLEQLQPETAVPDLEHVTARVVECIAVGSDASWEQGRVIFDYFRAGEHAAPKARATQRDLARHRRTAAKAIASGAGCSANAIVQHADVWAAFGAEDIRAEDKPWHLHRAVLLAAKRTKRTPAAVLEEALAKGWSVADLSTLGRSDVAVRRLVATCANCGLKVAMSAPRGTVAYDMTGALACPFCIGLGPALGVLT